VDCCEILDPRTAIYRTKKRSGWVRPDILEQSGTALVSFESAITGCCNFGRFFRKCLIIKVGGRGGIRTHGTVARTSDFESGAFNHSATLPTIDYQGLAKLLKLVC
jgi:hypothetical protein